MFGIFVVPDRMAGWKSAHRVIKEGGTFATAVWDVSSDVDFDSLVHSIPRYFPKELRPEPYDNENYKSKIPYFELSDRKMLQSELL